MFTTNQRYIMPAAKLHTRKYTKFSQNLISSFQFIINILFFFYYLNNIYPSIYCEETYLSSVEERKELSKYYNTIYHNTLGSSSLCSHCLYALCGLLNT